MAIHPGIRCKDLEHQIIRPALNIINMYSGAAVTLLLGTAAIESRMGSNLVQVQGPAVSPYMMEPATHDDIWINYLNYRTDIRRSLRVLSGQYGKQPSADVMIYNLRYATAMARIQYWRAKFSWPRFDGDIAELAIIYKVHYNTMAGKATPEKFVRRYQKYVEPYR